MRLRLRLSVRRLSFLMEGVNWFRRWVLSRITIDVKVWVGLFLVSGAISVFAALAIAHGLCLGFLDGVGGTAPP